jgi:enoyl-CoA hydratase
MNLVTYALDRAVATIRMDDGKANALSIPMLSELHAAFGQAEADGAIVVLTGREGTFSGGFHLPTLRGSAPDRGAMLRSGFDLAVRILTFPRPVVIASPGHAIAQASILLLCADERIGAAGPYKITLNEVLIGLIVARSMIEIGRYRLTPSQLHRTFALAEVYSPEAAIDAGFLDRIVPPGDVLDVAQETARRFIAFDTKAYAATKARLREDLLSRLRAVIEKEFPR